MLRGTCFRPAARWASSARPAYRMSASGYKRTYSGQLANVRFTPESGHSEAQERFGLKKRTLDVRFTPNSGRKWVTEFMSAYDPKRKLMVLGVWKNFMANRVITIAGTGNAASHNAS